jgi:hypothetical protein
VAAPVIDAEVLLAAHSTLTRLFTVISPEDMTEDPVFGFNTTLGAVSAQHGASQFTACEGFDESFQFGQVEVPRNRGPEGVAAIAVMPSAQTIEVLREEGAPEVLFDYQPMVPKRFGPAPGPWCGAAGAPGLLALTSAALRALRRRRTS